MIHRFQVLLSNSTCAATSGLGEFVKTREGVAMPRMMYGTAWKAERTADLVEAAIRAGFRGVDTACQPKHYREAGVGDAGTHTRTLFGST